MVNWLRRAETLECLAALSRLDYPRWCLILVDNGCRELSCQELSTLLPDASYVSTDANIGFTGGANLGMRQALRGGAEYVWFLNNDAQPEPAALTELVAIARRAPEIAIVGAKILQRDRPERLDSIALSVDLRWGRILLTGHGEIDHGQYDAMDQPAAVTGCAMLVSRAACERLGGFDDRFFAYLEDADLCLRARAAGLGVAVAPRARVLHNRPRATEGRQSAASLYYTTRNHLFLIHRHSLGTQPQRRLRLVVVAALNVAYAIRAGGGAPREHLRAVWCGVRDYSRGIVGGEWQSR